MAPMDRSGRGSRGSRASGGIRGNAARGRQTVPRRLRDGRGARMPGLPGRPLPGQSRSGPAGETAPSAAGIRLTSDADPAAVHPARADGLRFVVRSRRLRAAVRGGTRPAVGPACRVDALEPDAPDLDFRLQLSGAATEPDGPSAAAL